MQTLRMTVQVGDSLWRAVRCVPSSNTFEGAGEKAIDVCTANVDAVLCEFEEAGPMGPDVLVITLVAIRGTNKRGGI